MGEEGLNHEEEEALTTVKMASLRKKINAESWNPNMELLIKSWGEKSAGLRFMHANAAGSWKGFSNTLTLWSIGVTTFASGVSLIAASIDNPNAKNIVLYVTGAIGICSTLLQSLKKFYNAEEKAADHVSISKQFGSFYRYITLQMGMTREDRDPSDVLSSYALKEYERLMQESPPVGGGQIKLFRETFKNSNQAVPDVCERDFVINVYNPNTEETKINTEETKINTEEIKINNGNENGNEKCLPNEVELELNSNSSEDAHSLV